MPVGFNSPARNLFLLGSSGAQVVSNFFESISKASTTDGVFVPDEIRYIDTNKKYALAGSAEDSNSKGFGWFERQDYNLETGALTTDYSVRIESPQAGVNTTLRAMELDATDNLIVVGKTADIPWIAKYSNAGVLDWQSTTNTGDVEYTGITSDSSGNYYACGSTPTSGSAQAFVEKFDSNGNPGWGKQAFMLGRDVVLEKISANDRGEVVAVGYLEDDSADKGYIVKIDTTTGEVLWDRTLERNISGYGGGISPDDIAPANVKCTACYIDSRDQIYVVGTIDGNSPVDNGVGEFLIKYSPEGNIIWQRERDTNHYTILDGAPNTVPFDVKSDGETEQTVVLSVEDYGSFALFNSDIFISKYSKNGDLVFRRKISKGNDNLGAACLDADPSFYYIMFRDQRVDGLAGEPDRYTFGKVSTSGNGLGNFQYNDGTATLIDYTAVVSVDGSPPPQNKIGRLSDGSVTNSVSDLITYPFTANKLVFDDLATHVSNKKRQMDGADSFEYSGSPAIRPADFQELNLLGDVYSGSGDWLDQSGKGNDGVTSFTTSAEEPFPGAGSIEFDGTGDSISVGPLLPTSTGTAFTVDMFWRSKGNTVQTCLWEQHNSGPGRTAYFINGTNAFLISEGNTVGSFAYSDNVWYFTRVTYTAGGAIEVFVDGVSRGTGTQTVGVDNVNFVVGDRSGASESFNGYISNVRVITGSALSGAGQVPTSALTNTGFTAGNDYTGTVTSVTNAQGNFNLANAYLLFDGTIGSSGYGGGTNGSPAATVNFDGTVTWSSSIEVAGGMGATSSQVGGNSGFMRVNGFDVVPEMKAANQYAGGSPTTWVNVTSKVGSSGTLNSLGAQWIGGVANPAWFGIRLDGVHLIDIASTGTQLLTAQGGTIVDTSDNAFSITVNGDAAAAVGGTNTVAYNAAGGYFEFDGTNDYIQLATNSDLTFADDFSYETWLWTDVQPASNTIWSLPNGQTFQFTTLNSQQELIYYSLPTNNQSFGPLANNTWAHYIITKSGNTITGYLNGVQSWTVTPGSSETHNFSGASIGYRTIPPANSFYWDGRIGEVRIYPRALTAAQVFQNYNATREKYTGVPASTDPGLTSTRTP